MTYEEFLKFVPAKCIHETLYEDTEGRPILVISMLDAYDMVDKAQRPWVGLTKVQRDDFADAYGSYEAVCAIEQALKERNT
jgi:hypothetical protein